MIDPRLKVIYDLNIMPGRDPSDLIRIGQIISDSLEEGFLGLAKEMVRVFEVWEQAVGPFNAARTRPESIKNGRLTVLVAGSVWIDRFSYLKNEFIDRINRALGAPLVEDIVFRAGEIEPRMKPVDESRIPVKKQTAQPADSFGITQAVARIKDPGLRKQLASLLARQSTDQK